MFCLKLRLCLFTANPPQEPCALGWPRAQHQCSESAPHGFVPASVPLWSSAFASPWQTSCWFSSVGQKDVDVAPARASMAGGALRAGRSVGDGCGHAALPGWA